MTAVQLERRPKERIWGRRALPAGFEDCRAGGPVGEVWYENGARSPLLVKYLFTSAPLSIQVHPDDRSAHAHGHARGKDEAWLVVDAEPGAVIGLGLKRPMAREDVRRAALDGSIEALIDWRPVKKGDSFYSPAGTVHAIGGGLALIEIQQNLDVTYRLYDYGRPRPLQLDQALAVAELSPFAERAPLELAPGRRLLGAGGAFVVERWTFSGARTIAAAGDAEVLVAPLRSAGRLDRNPLVRGSVWQVRGEAMLETAAELDLLVAYPGGGPAPDLV